MHLWPASSRNILFTPGTLNLYPTIFFLFTTPFQYYHHHTSTRECHVRILTNTDTEHLPSYHICSLDSLSPFPNHHPTHLQSDTHHQDMLVQSDSLIGERTIHWYTESLSRNILVVHYPLSVLPPPYLHQGVLNPNTHRHQYWTSPHLLWMCLWTALAPSLTITWHAYNSTPIVATCLSNRTALLRNTPFTPGTLNLYPAISFYSLPPFCITTTLFLFGPESPLNDNAPTTVRMLDNNSLMVANASTWQSGSGVEKKVCSLGLVKVTSAESSLFRLSLFLKVVQQEHLQVWKGKQMKIIHQNCYWFFYFKFATTGVVQCQDVKHQHFKCQDLETSSIKILTLNISPSTMDMSLDSLGPFPNHHLTCPRSDTHHRNMLVQSDSLVGERIIHSWYAKSLSCNILFIHYPISVLPPPYLHQGVPHLNIHQHWHWTSPHLLWTCLWTASVPSQTITWHAYDLTSVIATCLSNWTALLGNAPFTGKPNLYPAIFFFIHYLFQSYHHHTSTGELCIWILTNADTEHLPIYYQCIVGLPHQGKSSSILVGRILHPCKIDLSFIISFQQFLHREVMW